jgi:vacuolar-type H+-ATPase subunit H
MSDDAERFRMRARECRELAPKARVEEVRRYLSSLADELEEEADKISFENGNKSRQRGDD